MHVLLTGASSGIGWSLAQHIGEGEVKLTLAARREEKLNELASALQIPTFVRPTDVSTLDECHALYRESVEALGPVDVLINNAGMQYVEPSRGISVERINRIIAVNLTAPMCLQQLALVDMLERNQGTIVNVASMAGITPTPGMMHYNATKAGLSAASESLRVELRGSGVNVLTVYPGPVKSPMEAAARVNLNENLASRYAPMGDSDVLAQLIWKAVKKRKARVVYPQIYGLARYSRITSQWMTNALTPGFEE